MILRLERRGENKGSFFWGCSSQSLCLNTKKYKVPENRFDFSNNNFMLILNSLSTKSDSEREEILAEINVQMIDILIHFIQCDWGSHYNTLFEMLIKPYLTDPNTLDFVLRSEIINEAKGNIMRGNTGAKIFFELYYYLYNVNSKEIKNYLQKEFVNTHYNIFSK
jgi:hypothetical protein